MKKKIVSIMLCVVLFGTGIMVGRITANGNVRESVEMTSNMEEYVPTETKAPDSVKSKLKNQEECYLCGNNNRSLMGLFRNYDDLGIICVNEWYVLDMRVRNHDDAGNLSGPTGSMNVTYSSQGKDECFFHNAPMSDRGISDVEVTYGENSYLDTKAVREKLCQNCLDKLWEVMEVRVPEGEEANPRDLCLVDFNTLELYSLQGTYSGYSVGDYWVEVDTSDEDKLKVTAVYAPVLQNGTKEGE